MPRTVTVVEAPLVGVEITITVTDTTAAGDEVIEVNAAPGGVPVAAGRLTLTKTQLNALNALAAALIGDARQAVVPGP